jgi:murein L,D-transpeptidase YcbB/YkuD
MRRTTIFILVLSFAIASCNDHKRINEKEIVAKPAEINKTARDIIKESLNDIIADPGNKELPAVKNVLAIKFIYDQNNYQPIWTGNGKWNAKGDSLYTLIDSARYFGLFPNDYYTSSLNDLRQRLLFDTSAKEDKLDAVLWARTELFLSDAFVQIIKDLRNGRIARDTTSLRKDTALTDSFFNQQLQFFKDRSISSFVSEIEPVHSGYQNLKAALRNFLVDADFRAYTYINPEDSINLKNLVLQRLIEDSVAIDSTAKNDSLKLVSAIKKYQKKKGTKPDGKLTKSIINSLNNTDNEKFTRIAITLDRYKQLPAKLPTQYIWVNIPEYYMYLWEDDTIRLKSRVVVGKPITHTPVLYSAITDMITYPQWTIPASIIKKEILPGLKKDPAYTLKKGFSLIDKDGNVVDPYFVDWSRFETGIPYKVVQGSGDDNALGVLKFNFSNKYSVYLHDTNQRYLFSKKERALSHGCVRVQSWDSLAYYILQNDSLAGKKALPSDSLNKWLSLKEKHVIPVRKRIPLFIRYFTCDAKDDKVVFYEDVYGDDKRLKEKFFANKN